MRALLFLLILLIAAPAFAGSNCKNTIASPQTMANAAASAHRVIEQLEKINAPVALLARHGQDLKKYDLHYSHVGFVVRDHKDGRWTVVHLLNQCSTAHSNIYAQGLVNFFIDDLQSQDARIVWLKPELANRLALKLNKDAGLSVFDSDYNVIARYDSQQYQNSTAWVLDVLSAATLSETKNSTRQQAQALQKAQGFIPDVVHVAYSQRVLGGLFSANTVFTDHSIGTRLSGDYKVVTVRAIFRHLEKTDLIQQQWEWRNLAEQKTPGPA